jgi:Plasmid pRiA4b ORF-3-like protein
MIAPIKKRPAQAFLICELKITLCGSNPAIWRRVRVPSDIKLNRLRDVLQLAMEWTVTCTSSLSAQ